jgi:hypothetical protein
MEWPHDNEDVTGAVRYVAKDLRVFAATCEQHDDDVCVRAHPAVPATGYQSTVDAVSALHAAASGTGDVLATRIRSTASALSSAAGRYSQAETQSADALSASMAELVDAALDIVRTVGCSAYVDDFQPPTIDASRSYGYWTTANGLIYDPRTPPQP